MCDPNEGCGVAGCDIYKFDVAEREIAKSQKEYDEELEQVKAKT